MHTKNSSTQRTTQIVGLDLIRFAAAMFVVLFHFTAWAPLAPSGTMHALPGANVEFPMMAQFTWLGWSGVEIFFILSGFVIPFSAEGRSAAKFAESRVLRLAPAAWICAALTVALMVALDVYGLKEGIGRFARSALFWPWGPWADGPFWTLAIEVAFYLVVFATIARRAFDRVALVVGAIGLASSGLWICSIFSPAIMEFLLTRWAQLLLLTHGCMFAAGLQIWLIRRRGLTLARGVVLAAFLVGVCIETYFAAVQKLAEMSLSGSALAAVLVVIGGFALICVSVALGRKPIKLLGNVMAP